MTNEMLRRVDRVEDLAAIRGPGPVMVSGPKDHVDALLRQVAASGRMLAMSAPKYYGGGVAVAVSLRPLQEQPQRVVQAHPVRRVSKPVVGAAAAGGLAAAAGLAWLVYAVATWIAAHVVLVLIIGAGLAALAGAGRRTCKTVITIIHKH